MPGKKNCFTNLQEMPKEANAQMSLITSSHVKWGTLIYEISMHSFCIMFLVQPYTNYGEPKKFLHTLVAFLKYEWFHRKGVCLSIVVMFVLQLWDWQPLAHQQMGSCKMPITEYTVTVQAVNQRTVLSNGATTFLAFDNYFSIRKEHNVVYTCSGAAKVALSPESCILLRKHETLHKCSMVPNYYFKKIDPKNVRPLVSAILISNMAPKWP